MFMKTLRGSRSEGRPPVKPRHQTPAEEVLGSSEKWMKSHTRHGRSNVAINLHTNICRSAVPLLRFVSILYSVQQNSNQNKRKKTVGPTATYASKRRLESSQWFPLGLSNPFTSLVLRCALDLCVSPSGNHRWAWVDTARVSLRRRRRRT